MENTSQIIYQNQIQLENDNNALSKRHCHLLETISQLEKQIDKEQGLREDFTQISEDCDKEKEDTI